MAGRSALLVGTAIIWFRAQRQGRDKLAAIAEASLAGSEKGRELLAVMGAIPDLLTVPALDNLLTTNGQE